MCTHTDTQRHAQSVRSHIWFSKAIVRKSWWKGGWSLGGPIFVEKATLCVLLVCVWTRGPGGLQTCYQAVNFLENKSASGLFGLEWFTQPAELL